MFIVDLLLKSFDVTLIYYINANVSRKTQNAKTPARRQPG